MKLTKFSIILTTFTIIACLIIPFAYSSSTTKLIFTLIFLLVSPEVIIYCFKSEMRSEFTYNILTIIINIYLLVILGRLLFDPQIHVPNAEAYFVYRFVLLIAIKTIANITYYLNLKKMPIIKMNNLNGNDISKIIALLNLICIIVIILITLPKILINYLLALIAHLTLLYYLKYENPDILKCAFLVFICSILTINIGLIISLIVILFYSYQKSNRYY